MKFIKDIINNANNDSLNVTFSEEIHKFVKTLTKWFPAVVQPRRSKFFEAAISKMKIFQRPQKQNIVKFTWYAHVGAGRYQGNSWLFLAIQQVLAIFLYFVSQFFYNTRRGAGPVLVNF